MYPDLKHLKPYSVDLSREASMWMKNTIGEGPYLKKEISHLDEFKALIEPLRSNSKGLVFRGHASCNWDLFSRYERAQQFKERSTNDTSRNRFGPANQIKDPSLDQLKRKLKINDNKWDGQLLSMLQHYGAPTTLLDWTESIDVALFFAANYAADPCVKYASLFIVDAGKVNEDLEVDGENKSFCHSKFYAPDAFFDLRIQAQSGLFLMSPVKGLYSLFPPALDNAVKNSDAPKAPDHTMVKINIHRKLCTAIAADLETRGISWDSVFPPSSMEDMCRIVEQDVLRKLYS